MQYSLSTLYIPIFSYLPKLLGKLLNSLKIKNNNKKFLTANFNFINKHN